MKTKAVDNEGSQGKVEGVEGGEGVVLCVWKRRRRSGARRKFVLSEVVCGQFTAAQVSRQRRQWKKAEAPIVNAARAE